MSTASSPGSENVSLMATSEARRTRLAVRLGGCISEAAGWRRGALAFAAGSVSVLAMAPLFLWPVLFLTMPTLVWLIDGSGESCRGATQESTARAARAAVGRAAVAGWWFGFGYFAAGLFWIGEAFLVEADKFAWLLPFAVTLMPAGLAFFTASAAATARLLWMRGPARVLVLAISLAAAEWLRGHVLTGFPWNVLGYALTYPLPLMQSAAVLGIYGLTLWAVVIFASPLVLAADIRAAGRWRQGFLVAAIPLAVLWAFGAWRLASTPAPVMEGTRLRVVQPSVSQRDKWRAEKQGEIFQDHLALSRQDATGRQDDLTGITHLVWPEAAMPFLPLNTPDALAAIGELLPAHAQLITGALRVADTRVAGLGGVADTTPARRRAYNSLMVFGEGGGLSALYDKIHLVPFGEYLPFQETLESIGLEQLTRVRGGFSVGDEPRPLISVAGLPPIAGLICYEAIFPSAVVQGSDRPGLLVNVTNDGWFGNTSGPYQHFHQSRVRAVEEGIPLVRAANNGISAVIDADGRVLARLALNERGTIDSVVPGVRPPTVYARFGDWVFLVNAIVFAALALWRSVVVLFMARLKL